MAKVAFIGSEAGGHSIQAGIQAGLTQGAYRTCASVQLSVYPQTLYSELPRLLAAERPDFLHLACHGIEEGVWLSQTHNDPESAQLLSPPQLAQLLAFPGGKVVLIDACKSAAMAETLYQLPASQVKIAIGYAGDISVKASQQGACVLHEQLASGSTYADALTAMQGAVHTLASLDQVRYFADPAFLTRTLVPEPPRLIARFKKGSMPKRDRHGDYHVEFGVLGLPVDQRSVVAIFSDEGTLVDDGYSTVVAGYPRAHVGPDAKATSLLWTHDYDGEDDEGEIWVVGGNFDVFASCVSAGGHIVVKSNLRETLVRYYMDKSFAHAQNVRAQAAETIDKMA